RPALAACERADVLTARALKNREVGKTVTVDEQLDVVSRGERLRQLQAPPGIVTRLRGDAGADGDAWSRGLARRCGRGTPIRFERRAPERLARERRGARQTGTPHGLATVWLLCKRVYGDGDYARVVGIVK